MAASGTSWHKSIRSIRGRLQTMEFWSSARDVLWLRGLTVISSTISWIYSCGCLGYCIYLLLRVELSVLPSMHIYDIQTGLVIILCSSALTMVTGMAGACGAVTLKRGPLLLHCCVTALECLGFLAAGTVALRNRVTIGVRLEGAFNELLKNYISSSVSDETVHQVHTIQAVLRCCGKNGIQDYMKSEKSQPCFSVFAQIGCLRAALNLMAAELFHQSCVGFAGAFSLLLSLFSAASLLTPLRTD